MNKPRYLHSPDASASLTSMGAARAIFHGFALTRFQNLSKSLLSKTGSALTTFAALIEDTSYMHWRQVAFLGQHDNPLSRRFATHQFRCRVLADLVACQCIGASG